MTPSGKLTRRLRFESPQAQPDGYGDAVTIWQEEFTTSAEVFARSGGEQVLAARLSGIQPVEITVRRFAATARITSAWRVIDVHSGEMFALVAPPFDPDGSRAFVKMLGRSGVAT